MCHLFFDDKMDCTPQLFVINWATTDTSTLLTYSGVISRHSIKLSFMIAAPNDFVILACNNGNAYLIAPCREKIWCEAGNVVSMRVKHFLQRAWAVKGEGYFEILLIRLPCDQPQSKESMDKIGKEFKPKDSYAKPTSFLEAETEKVKSKMEKKF
ncbi:LOW QUALITY PROTEIN: hypothetical protein ACHAXS_005909 [Conticribra weissflogii]